MSKPAQKGSAIWEERSWVDCTMRIVNKTDYNTAHLRAFLFRIAQKELSADERRRLMVTVLRRNHITGRSWKGQFRFSLSLSPQIADKVHLACTIAWLMGMSSGLSQKDMAGLSRYHCGPASAGFHPWASTMPLEHKPPAPSNKADKLERQWRNAQKMIKTWERKLKLAQTKVRNWKQADKKLNPRMIAAKLQGL